jgi:hypothetical protein
MNDDDFKIIDSITSDNITWDMDMHGNSHSITITTDNSSVFTRYPDLASRQVREGLGVDVIQDIKRNLDDKQ